MTLLEASETLDVRPRLDLAARATVFCVCLLGMMSFISIFLVLGMQRDHARRESEDAARGLSVLAGQEAAADIAAGRFGHLSDLVRRLAHMDHVRRVVVFDAQGRARLAWGGVGGADEAGVASYALRENADARTETPGAVLLATRQDRSGVIVIGLSRASIDAEFDEMAAPFVLTLMAFLLISAPLTYLVVRRITRPMRALTDFARSITHAGPGQRLILRTRDEFETLANAFNHMIDGLEDKMRRIEQLSFVDPVTALPNQVRFERELADAIANASKDESQAAIIMFEFERVRRLLETLDRDAAQELTTLVAYRLVNATRAADRVVRVQTSRERPAIVACLRNDDFGVLAPSITDASQAARLAQMICSAMDQPLEWRGDRLSLGAICGVAIAPRDGVEAATVIRHAAMALSAARKGEGKLKLYTRSLDQEATNRVKFERAMRGALERNEFRAFFQPKINFTTGRIEAAEALARWVRPDRTIISPGAFIPAAEENGLIADVSDAVLREACWKAAAWAREGNPISAAVNVSALQFRNEKFAEHVLRILEHSGLPPHLLELEITETVAMEDPERTARLIAPLREVGVRFAIDDFGCGHSSLGALTRMPFDVIKIDKQFVGGLAQGDRYAPAIVDTILAMARTLDLEVVGEGVERREEAEFLIARGCGFGQGFLYSAAVTPAEFATLLRSQRAGHIIGGKRGADAA